jgi:N-acetylmuramoyl-L-alanine amidase
MNRSVFGLIIAFFANIWIFPASAWAVDLKVSSIRVGNHGDYTRFVLDIDGSVEPRVFTLADPYRVVIDLPEVEWAQKAQPSQDSRGLVAGYRFGLFRPGNARVVIDLTAPAEVGKIFSLQPDGTRGHRLVIDLKETNREAFVASAGWPKSQRKTSPRKPVPLKDPKKRSGKYVVVIDPGHGGIDPGAAGRSGILEKEVALKVGKDLRKQLQANGRYKVVMTRDKDIFHSLTDRVEIARSADADLFISLHADTIKSSKVRGAAVYTLSEKASDSEADELARKENRSDIIAGVDISQESTDVSKILIELSQRETMNRSVHFAEILMPELSKQTTLLRNTHRYAGFQVLKAPDVPSVLLELGYMSNRQDEKNLKSAKWRGKVARSISAAVDQHFKTAEEEGFYNSRQAFLK